MKRAGITFRFLEKVAPYEEALRAAGIEPVRIPADEPRTLEGLQGLLVSGGCDVNPRLYHEEPDPRTDPPDDTRDALEARLIADAAAACNCST
jgi:putative glutamine amidotransferase